MALYSNSNDRILRKSMISVMTETTISCLKSGQKEKKTPLLLTKNLLLPLLSVNVIFFRLSVFELWIFCHGGKTQQFKVPVSSSNADAEGECYSKQIIHFSNLECLNKISLTESWGSSRFFYSKSGVNFSFWPLFETWESQNLGYFKNLSLEFGLNATRLSAQLSEHENPH